MGTPNKINDRYHHYQPVLLYLMIARHRFQLWVQQVLLISIILPLSNWGLMAIL